MTEPEEERPHRDQASGDASKSRRVLGLSFEALSLIFDGVIAIAAIVGSVFVYRQLTAMNGQLAIMREQMKDARAAAKSAGVTTDRQLKVAEKQADSQKTLADANKDIAAATMKSADSMAKLSNMSERSAASTKQLADATLKAAEATRSLAESAGRSSAATQRLADAAAMQLERMDRPYLAVSASGNGPVTATEYPTSTMEFNYQILVVNEGRSAARTVRIRSKIAYDSYKNILTRKDTKLLGEEIDTACIDAANLMDHYGIVDGGTIRPSEQFSVKLGHVLSGETIRAHIVGHSRVPGGAGGYLFAPIIIGCVAYTIPYSTRMHHTPFAFNIFPKTPKWPEWYFFRQGATVEEIIMVQNEDVLAQHQPD